MLLSRGTIPKRKAVLVLVLVLVAVVVVLTVAVTAVVAAAVLLAITVAVMTSMMVAVAVPEVAVAIPWSGGVRGPPGGGTSLWPEGQTKARLTRHHRRR